MGIEALDVILFGSFVIGKHIMGISDSLVIRETDLACCTADASESSDNLWVHVEFVITVCDRIECGAYLFVHAILVNYTLFEFQELI